MEMYGKRFMVRRPLKRESVKGVSDERGSVERAFVKGVLVEGEFFKRESAKRASVKKTPVRKKGAACLLAAAIFLGGCGEISGLGNGNEAGGMTASGSGGTEDVRGAQDGNSGGENYGSGNPESGSQGSGNLGTGNAESGSQGSGNQGSGSLGSGNQESGNPGTGGQGSGSGQQSAEGMYTYTPPEMKGEITISVMFEQEYLKAAAEQFTKQYPDVKISFHAAADGPDAGGNYRTLLNTRLMSGKAEDIIFASELPIQKYMDMGVFEDLSGYMAATPDMNEDNYFMNVLTSAQDERGRLFLLPYKISFWTINFDEKLADKDAEIGAAESIRFSKASEYGEKLTEKSNLINTFLTQNNLVGYMQNLIQEFRNTLFDPATGEVNINTDRYIGWLNKVQEMQNKGYFHLDNSINYYNTEYHFAMQEDYDVQAAFYELAEDSGSCMTMPIADEGGNVYVSSSNFFGISSASENKELAWEFVKFLLSPQIQSLPSMYGIAVNKEGFDASVKRQLTFYANASSKPVSQENYKALLEKWVRQINKCDTMDSLILNFFAEENQKFFDGKQSAEQTAQTIQNKVLQYLNE